MLRVHSANKNFTLVLAVRFQQPSILTALVGDVCIAAYEFRLGKSKLLKSPFFLQFIACHFSIISASSLRAGMAELVDALGLGSSGFFCAGSSPVPGTFLDYDTHGRIEGETQSARTVR